MLKLKDGYYAKDKNGDVCIFKNKPVIYDTWWDSDIKINLKCSVEITESWEDSLYHVKDGVVTKVVTFVKDQKVLVLHNVSNKWVRRYYSHEENGKHYVYINGANSWVGNDTIDFKYIKPYIEGEDN